MPALSPGPRHPRRVGDPREPLLAAGPDIHHMLGDLPQQLPALHADLLLDVIKRHRGPSRDQPADQPGQLTHQHP